MNLCPKITNEDLVFFSWDYLANRWNVTSLSFHANKCINSTLECKSDNESLILWKT